MKTINFGKKPIKVVKHKRSKYMRLRVSSAGEIKLTVPTFTPSYQIANFLDSHKPWLEEVLSHVKPAIKPSLVSGSIIHIIDKEFTIKTYNKQDKPKAYIDDEAAIIHIFTNDEADKREIVAGLIRDSLIEYGRKIIKHKSSHYARLLNTSFQRISIREQKTRWGSCSSSGNLNFNWKILLAPQSVFNYVVAHEIAHLREHNHSSRFWKLVADVCPDYQQSKRWLKNNAHSLEIL